MLTAISADVSQREVHVQLLAKIRKDDFLLAQVKMCTQLPNGRE